jgi:large subunit ribosomal protein L21
LSRHSTGLAQRLPPDNTEIMKNCVRGRPIKKRLVNLRMTQRPTLTPLQYGRYNFRLSSLAIFWRELTVAYAIIQAGGKQFRVTEGEVVRIPSLTAEVGSSVNLDALLHGDGGNVELGGNSVTATVVEHGRGLKIIVFKKKRRKQYKKTHGHRQNYTAVRIESIGSASE